MMIRRLHVLQGILLLLAVYLDSGVLAEAEVNFDDAGESGRDQLEALLNGEGGAMGEDGSNSTEQTEAPSSLTVGTTAPTTYEEYVYNYDEVVGIEYAKPGTENWPSDEVWESGLRALLSPGASLIDNLFVNNKVAYDFLCLGLEGYDMLKEGNGVCMIDEDCKFRFCGRDGNGVFNLPAYTVDPRSVQDIQAAVRFANQHNIQVSVKNTGHNFVGASVQANSINIWMANFPKNGTIHEDWQDSCGTNHGAVLSSNGGEIFNDVFGAIGEDYHIITGDTHSVGFAGWLQGVGLSHTSRTYGLGVDQVRSFDVVLPNGDFVTADACSHPDLFWALRGGGGGTFGVVTNMKYQLQPVTQITAVEIIVNVDAMEAAGNEDLVVDASRAYLRWWAKVSPDLDPRVAGAWFSSADNEIFILADVLTARQLFIKDLEEWFENDFLATEGFLGSIEVTVADSWFELMGGTDPSPGSLLGDGHGPRASTRLVPQSMVREDPEEVADFLTDLVAEVSGFGAYWLGGVVNKVPGDATAVHPAMREAEYGITTTTREAASRVRDYLPNDITGCSYNHHSPNEPQWRECLWGSNYRRLLGIKNRYDPNRIFNCWHCVGYQGLEYEEDTGPPASIDDDDEPEDDDAAGARLMLLLPSILLLAVSTVMFLF